VTYEVYIRSFADGDGDGIGDIAGLRSRLSYLSDLGVDAVWITPWYPSPMADAGYDIADYRDVDPLFGTMAEAEKFIVEAHALGIRVLVDVVPNHTSDRHEWFRAALAADPGSLERSRYWFRPGRGPKGEVPPNDWLSRFGGSAWTRVADDRGRPGEWYLHLYAPEQPDLNWDNPEVREEFESVLRFWLGRGVDGFRVDVAHALIKDPTLPDVGYSGDDTVASRTGRTDHPHWDRDEVHEIYRAWRRIAEDFDGDRTFVAEAWVASPERLARYVQRDGLHTAFNFGFLQCPWDATALRRVVDATVGAHATVGAPPTWVLSNHDVVRHVTRYGRTETGWQDARRLYGSPVDVGLGTRRARAAALLLLALPGGAYLYQGEELGLWEVEDLPDHLLQDPAWLRGGRRRDGCRVPLPWSGDQPPFGFSPEDATASPWLPQPAAWSGLTAEAQNGDPDSMLELYRAALRIRRAHPALGDGDLAWDDTPQDVLSFTRTPGFRCVVNLASEPITLGRHHHVLLASTGLQGGRLAPDAVAWLQTDRPRETGAVHES
jgi:alpha-glucosidase